MDEKALERLIELATVVGVENLEVRMEISLVLEGQKVVFLSFQTTPELFPHMVKGMTTKIDEVTEIKKLIGRAANT